MMWVPVQLARNSNSAPHLGKQMRNPADPLGIVRNGGIAFLLGCAVVQRLAADRSDRDQKQ